jgi:hypothetical protein
MKKKYKLTDYWGLVVSLLLMSLPLIALISYYLN